MAMLTGWCAYAYFENCDPIQNEWIGARDQIIPYLSLYMFAAIAPGVARVQKETFLESFKEILEILQNFRNLTNF